MNKVDAGAVELCYERFGRGDDPTLVLVHGLASNLATWDRALVQLLVDNGFSVLTLDTRDAGCSTILDDAPAFDMAAALRGDRSVVTYTLDDMADDLAGLLHALDVDGAHLVGVSMGGMIAQMTAVRHPELVLSLCSIMSTTGAPDVGLPTPEAAQVLTRRPARGRQGFVEQELENNALIGSRAPELVDVPWRRAKFERLYDHGVHSRGSGRQLMAILASGDRTAGLAAVSVPTVVVHGDADSLIDVSGGKATAAAIPGAQLRIVPGMGHELPPATWPVVVPAIVENARRGETARQAMARQSR
ncbi:MAG TPA: alpha/beta hydrolase [Acidimicrobiaceae bacterium]|nr:alpha/beta hydrolase [Acidimicrobiaceae bacterium]